MNSSVKWAIIVFTLWGRIGTRNDTFCVHSLISMHVCTHMATAGVCVWFLFNLPMSLEMSSEEKSTGDVKTQQLASAQDSAQEAMNQFVLFFRFTGSFKALGFFEMTALMELSTKGIYMKFQWYMIFTRTEFELSCGETTAAPAGTSTDFSVKFEAWNEGMQAVAKKMRDGIDEFQKNANAEIDKVNEKIKQAAAALGEECDKIGMGEQDDYSEAATAERAKEKNTLDAEKAEAEAKEQQAIKDAEDAEAAEINAGRALPEKGGTWAPYSAAPVVDKWTAEAKAKGDAEVAAANTKGSAEEASAARTHLGTGQCSRCAVFQPTGGISAG